MTAQVSHSASPNATRQPVCSDVHHSELRSMPLASSIAFSLMTILMRIAVQTARDLLDVRIRQQDCVHFGDTVHELNAHGIAQGLDLLQDELR